jgi:hydroxymethylpyrimidine pyrophosphatase-like HAD family hydrolase
MEKIILLYSDLEGTILRESDSEYDDTDMYNFLKQLSRLQELMDAKVRMHIVSPISQNQMTDILEKLDKSFTSFNRLQKEPIKKLKYIEGAAASSKDEFVTGPQQDFTFNRFVKKMDSRIVALKRPSNSDDKNPAGFGKLNYVKGWTSMAQERYDVKMIIYCGNGMNDLASMDYVNSKKGGFVVCPDNSRHEAKAKTKLVGRKTDLQGLTEGIANINKLLEKRLNPNKEEPEDNDQQSL